MEGLRALATIANNVTTETSSNPTHPDRNKPPAGTRRIPFAVLLFLSLGAAAVVALGVLSLSRPRLGVDQVRSAIQSTIEREAAASFLVTGTLDVVATTTVSNTLLVLPGILDLSLGTTTARVRIPGRVTYGFEVDDLRGDMIRFTEQGDLLVQIPILRVHSVEPDLSAMEVETEIGWARTRARSGAAAERQAFGLVNQALREQGVEHLAGSVQPRINAAHALAGMLRPVLDGLGMPPSTLRFDLGEGLILTFPDRRPLAQACCGTR